MIETDVLGHTLHLDKNVKWGFSTLLLSLSCLPLLPDHVKRPLFDVASLRGGIVHLGCGNFHRAHQAVATQAAITREGDEGLQWGIISASMRKPDLARQLRAQDNLYTLLTREDSTTTASVIGSLHEVIFSGDDRQGLPNRIADPQTKIVTLTVTASGYALNAEGSLDDQNPQIRRDLRRARPRSVMGVLAAGLELVRNRGTRPPVILCCDNISDNGATLRQAVIDYASLQGSDALANWIATHVQFPNTMVDRIAPSTNSDDLDDARRMLGEIEDAVPVSAEPWFQWIIAKFDGPRPIWEAYRGTRFVRDVAIFERAKLQMLNGSHMLLAYVGALAGLNVVSDAASDPILGRITKHFMREEQSAGVELSNDDCDSYADDLMRRFCNPGIVHEAERIGRNGSAKMADRVIRPMRENVEASRPVLGATLLIASWIRWFALHEQEALEISLTDEKAASLKQICAEARDDHLAQAQAFMAMEEVFGPPLPDAEKHIASIAHYLKRLTDEDPMNVLRDTANSYAALV